MFGAMFPPAPMGMPTIGYNWWDYAQDKVVDTKVTKIGYSLASVLARDRLKEQSQMVPDIKVKLFDYGADNELFMVLESLGFKIERIKTPEVPQHVIHNKLDPNQVVFISNLVNPQPREVFQGFAKFVEEGGRLLFFHCAPHWINVIFPGKVIAKDHNTCVGSKIKITGDKELFTGYAFNEDLELEHSRWPLDVQDRKSVKVLCKTYTNIVEPLLLRWSHGSGIVYIFVAQLLTKDRDPNEYSNYLSDKNVGQEALAAWNCAFSVGYKDAIKLAVKLYPSMELLSKLVLREWAVVLPKIQQRLKEEAEARAAEELANTSNKAEEENSMVPESIDTNEMAQDEVVDQLDNTLFTLVQYKIPLSKHTWRILLKTTPLLVVAEFGDYEEAITEWRWLDAEFTQKYVHLLHKDQLLHFLLAKFQSFSINPPASHKQRKGLTLANNKRASKGPDGHEIGHGTVTIDAAAINEFEKLFPEQKKERLISIYYCSLWTSKIPIRGTLYVSDFSLCFSSSFLKSGIIIKFSDIRTLVKETHKSVNTVKITTNDIIYWFAIFFNREEIYLTLLQLWKLALRRVLKTAESMDNIFHNNNNNNTSLTHAVSNTISPTKEELVSKYRDSNYQALFRLPPTEVLNEELTCKLLKGKTYRKGTLYISNGFICFYSLPYTPHNLSFSVVIPFQEIITMNISEEESIEEGGLSINIFTCTTQFSIQTPTYIELLDLLQDLHNKINNNNSNLQLDTPSIWQSSIPPRISSNMIQDTSNFSTDFVDKEEKLSEKWYLYTLKHGEGSTIKTNTLSKLVREGIPMNIRGKQWLLWGGGYTYLLRFPVNYYSSLLNDNKNSHTLAIEEIDKDLHRTCPEHEYYQSSIGIQSLRNVLVAYSWHNPTIGYCQSMNMVVSYLLLFLPEDQAFFLLCSICELLVPDYYIKQMLGSLVDQRIFEELLEEKCSNIHSHLKSIGLPLPMITLPWFLCLFIGYVPTEVSLRILDCFFYDGPNILFGFALALFKLHESDILKLDEGTLIINLLRQNVSNVDTLLSMALLEYSSIAVATIDEKRLFQRSKAVKEMELKSKKAVLRELKKSTKFDLNELEAIYSNFISKSANGHTLDYSQFDELFKYQVTGYNLSTLELANHLDKKHTNIIQFTDFVTVMSLLLKGSIEDRLTYCFAVYSDEDALITLPMFKIMATLLYYLHKSTKVPKKEKKDEFIVDDDPFFSFVNVNQELPLWTDDTIDQNFKDADVDQDNKLSFEDVQKVILKNPIFALALDIE